MLKKRTILSLDQWVYVLRRLGGVHLLSSCQLVRQNANTVLDISAGPGSFQTTAGPVRATTFDLVLARTGHQDICRAIRFQIMLARTITNLIIYFSRAHPPHISAVFAQSFCNSETPAWCESESDLSIKHTNVIDQAQQCLDHAARDTSMRTSVASEHFSSTSTCVNSFAFSEFTAIFTRYWLIQWYYRWFQS